MSNPTAATVQKVAKILVYLEELAPDYTAVAAAASHFASHFKAQLLLVNAAYDERAEELEFLTRKECDAIKGKCLAEHREWLERARHHFHCEGSAVHAEVVWDKHSYRAVVRKAIEHSADLVIKHLGSHTPFYSERLGTLDRNLLRFSPAPVLLIKKPFPGLYTRILAAIDPLTREQRHEQLNKEIIAWSDTLSTAAKSELHSVSAYPDMNMTWLFEGGASGTEQTWREKMEAHCRERLNRLFEAASVAPAALHIREGGCDRVILDLVDELHANVLVLGSVARSGLSSLFVGNTVEKILDKVDCDVLCIKPANLAESLRRHMLDELKRA